MTTAVILDIGTKKRMETRTLFPEQAAPQDIHDTRPEQKANGTHCFFETRGDSPAELAFLPVGLSTKCMCQELEIYSPSFSVLKK